MRTDGEMPALPPPPRNSGRTVFRHTKSVLSPARTRPVYHRPEHKTVAHNDGGTQEWGLPPVSPRWCWPVVGLLA